MSQLFASDGQSIRASASASVFLMNIQVISSRIDWFDLLAVQGTFKIVRGSRMIRRRMSMIDTMSF